jgi:hypothetical protein
VLKRHGIQRDWAPLFLRHASEVTIENCDKISTVTLEIARLPPVLPFGGANWQNSPAFQKINAKFAVSGKALLTIL